MMLKNECYGRLLIIPIRCNTLQMVLRYCKNRAKIKLQHSLYDGDDDDDDENDEDFAAQQKKKLKIFNSKFLQYDDEDLTAQQKKQLKKFDSKFLQAIYQCPDYHLPLDILDAAVSLHIKSLYDLVIDDVAAICERLSSKQILKIFKVGRHHYQEKFCSLRWFSWAFNIKSFS
uniref:uncharacterized protein LOC122602108 n=1 Tax=Erigeron canadensis TaxID=72917 RepID=UPI001CB916CC|nr:uncharacterized protein LOC122602108 [Erigeron canadensis]